MAGGASFAPSRWSLPGLDDTSLSKSACSSTAAITADRNKRNWTFSWGVLPGSNKFFPLSVVSDQLLQY